MKLYGASTHSQARLASDVQLLMAPIGKKYIRHF